MEIAEDSARPIHRTRVFVLKDDGQTVDPGVERIESWDIQTALLIPQKRIAFYPVAAGEMISSNPGPIFRRRFSEISIEAACLFGYNRLGQVIALSLSQRRP